MQTYRRINFRSDEPARPRAGFRPEVRAGTLKNIPVPIKYFPAARVIRAVGTLRSLDDSIEETSRRDRLVTYSFLDLEVAIRGRGEDSREPERPEKAENPDSFAFSLLTF